MGVEVDEVEEDLERSISWVLKKESWRKNLLINQEPRSVRSSPCCTVSEYRF